MNTRISFTMLDTARDRGSLVSLAERTPENMYLVESNETLSRNCLQYYVGKLKLQNQVHSLNKELQLLRHDTVQMMLEICRLQDIEQAYNRIVQELENKEQPPSNQFQLNDISKILEEVRISKTISEQILKIQSTTQQPCKTCFDYETLKQLNNQLVSENNSLKIYIEQYKNSQSARNGEEQEYRSETRFINLQEQLDTLMQMSQKSLEVELYVCQEIEGIKNQIQAQGTSPKNTHSLSGVTEFPGLDREKYLRNFFREQNKIFNWHRKTKTTYESSQAKSMSKTKQPPITGQDDPLSIIMDESGENQTGEPQSMITLKKAQEIYRPKKRTHSGLALKGTDKRLIFADRNFSPSTNERSTITRIQSAKAIKKQY